MKASNLETARLRLFEIDECNRTLKDDDFGWADKHEGRNLSPVANVKIRAVIEEDTRHRLKILIKELEELGVEVDNQ